MIVDTSAIVAIALHEEEASSFVAAMSDAVRTRMSAASYLECSIVLDAERNPVLSNTLDELIATLTIEIVPVTASQVRVARQAYRDFGKGSGHPAHLNFGGCFTYALVTESREPLLFKGDDFGHTGVRSAL